MPHLFSLFYCHSVSVYCNWQLVSEFMPCVFSWFSLPLWFSWIYSWWVGSYLIEVSFYKNFPLCFGSVPLIVCEWVNLHLIFSCFTPTFLTALCEWVCALFLFIIFSCFTPTFLPLNWQPCVSGFVPSFLPWCFSSTWVFLNWQLVSVFIPCLFSRTLLPLWFCWIDSVWVFYALFSLWFLLPLWFHYIDSVWQWVT